MSFAGYPTNTPDQRAGYTLLEKLRERHINTPFVIYTGSNRREDISEARRKGAVGTTKNAEDLFELVVNAIKNG